MNKNNVCAYCQAPAAYLVGSTDYRRRKRVDHIYGYVCLTCLLKAVSYVMHQCFGTTQWPVIKKGDSIAWHGYDAEQQGRYVLSDLNEYLEEERKRSCHHEE